MKYVIITEISINPVSATTKYIWDAHNQRIIRKKKSLYSNLFLVGATHPPLIQHPKSNFFKSDASKKEPMHKHRHHLIIDLRILAWRKFTLLNNAFNKVIARHNQLRLDLKFSLRKEDFVLLL
jgi:hypothetical protein